MRVTQKVINRGIAYAALPKSYENWIFFVLVCAFLLVRLINLEDFPIYFFCDEAFIGNQAEQLIKNNFRDAYGNLLPLFFEKAPRRWVPQLSLYIYMMPVFLFGKSIQTLRMTTGLISVVAPISLALTAKYVFKLKSWWLAVAVLSVTPTFLLHTRTAFETALVIVFYAGFVAFYAFYRTQNPRAIFPAVICAAFCAYLHFSGTITIVSILLALLLIDWPYHYKNRGIFCLAIIFSLILASPLLHLLLTRWEVVTEQLREVFSPWQVKSASSLAAGSSSLFNYLSGFSPTYWFFPEPSGEMSRHIWKDRGNISQVFLPFFALGSLLAIFSIKKPEYRIILVSFLASFVPLLVVERGIMRIFSFVVPATLLITIGLDQVVQFLSRLLKTQIITSVVAVLFIFQHWILFNEVRQAAPRWYQDYGLYGMQYGAKQLFQELIPRLLRQFPEQNIYVPVSWANGTEEFFNFFLSPAQSKWVKGGSIEYFTSAQNSDLSKSLVIMMPQEFEIAKQFEGFSTVYVQDTLRWPNGEIGFYITRLTYSEKFPSIVLHKEAQLRQIIVEEQKTLCGSTELHYSLTDMGTLKEIFDDDQFTLMRGAAADPYHLSLKFTQSCELSEILVYLAGNNYVLDIQVADDHGRASKLSPVLEQENNDSWFSIKIPQSTEAIKSVDISIDDLNADGKSNIHIRELKLRTRSK